MINSVQSLLMSQTTLLDFHDTDIVTAVKTVEVRNRSYHAIQMATFESLGTTPRDWVMCEIEDVFDTGRGREVVFVIPENYTEIPHTRFPEVLHYLNCQLCGHPIIYPYFIQNDAKKLVLQVGSECVNTYHGAHYTQQVIKIFLDNRIRQTYRGWRDLALQEIDSHRNGNRWLPRQHWLLWKKIMNTNDMTSTSRVIANLMKKGNKLLFNKVK